LDSRLRREVENDDEDSGEKKSRPRGGRRRG
jgi:hypothetical protein